MMTILVELTGLVALALILKSIRSKKQQETLVIPVRVDERGF